MGVRLGGPPAKGAPAPCLSGPAEEVGWPASREPQGHAECSAAASRQQPQTMWFQSNCPKILLQHKPRAIHSPATNQRQSYRINRFHTRGADGPGARSSNPGCPGRGRHRQTCFLLGVRTVRASGGHGGVASSLCGPAPFRGAELEGTSPLRECTQAPEGRPGHWGQSRVSSGQPRPGGPRGSPSSLRPDHPPRGPGPSLLQETFARRNNDNTTAFEAPQALGK